MRESNLQRLIRLADETFAVKNDPSQLNVDEKVLKRLRKIHPATINEFDDGNGPVAWVLVIPTTLVLMQKFLDKEITEKALFEMTPFGGTYEALYLCSALVLEEYRRKGLTTKLTLNAIDLIRKDHPLEALFVWPFSREGDLASDNISRISLLPLHKRK
jgi:hypothetical protein